jgi:hypothetical protein
MRSAQDILKEAEDKQDRLEALEDQFGDGAYDKEEHFNLTLDLSFLMRDFINAKFWEDRQKSKTYYDIPGVKDFYSDKIGSVELDPEIAEAVHIFNEIGCNTIASCAGHVESNGKISEGYVWMSNYPIEGLPKGLYFKGNAVRWRPRTEKGLKKAQQALLLYAQTVAPKYKKKVG